MKAQRNIELRIKKILEDKQIDPKLISKKLEINLADFEKSMEGKRKLSASEFLSICLYLSLKIEDFRGNYCGK